MTAVINTTATGVLNLQTTLRDGRSYASHQFHQGTLRILKPHYLDETGQVAYTIINPGGAYFGGDRYEIVIKVGKGSALLLTTQSATKVYRTPQGPACQNMSIRVGSGAVFEYLPDQLIVYRQGHYRQVSEVEIEADSTLVMAEIITPGWSPDGKPFAYDTVHMSTRLTVGGKLTAIDRLRIVPDEDITVLDGSTHTGQLLLASPKLDSTLYERLALIVEKHSAHSGITHVSPTCVAIRSLANRTDDIARLHEEVVNAFRDHTGGRPTLNLRKH